MTEQVDDSAELVERVAALDIGKATVMACTRIPHEDGRRRLQEVREYGTTTGALLALAGQLHELGVTLVVMEATSDYVRCDGAWVQVGGAAGGRFRP